MELHTSDIRSLFHSHDLRHTRQREVVFQALAATKSHPTAEELHRAVQEAEPGLSLATVYNTLEALTACGLSLRIPGVGESGACRYDADTSAHAHVHHPDGRLEDIPHDLSERLMDGIDPEVLQALERRLGISVARVSIQVDAR